LTIIFDTATDSYDFSTEFKMNVGCLSATAKYGASMEVEGVKERNVKGTFSLKCDTVMGNGEISGVKRESIDGDNLGETVYALTLTFVGYNIYVGSLTVILGDAVAKLDGVMTSEGDFSFSTMDWTMAIEGSYQILSPAGIPALPETLHVLSANQAASLTAKQANASSTAGFTFSDTFQLSADTLTYTSGERLGGSLPFVEVTGSTHFAYPCERGSSVSSTATIKFNMDGLTTDEDGIHASMTTFCRPEAGSPAITLTSKQIGDLEVVGRNLVDATVHLTAFKCQCCDRHFDPCDLPAYIFKGKVTGTHHGEDRSVVDVTVVLDSLTGKVESSANIKFETGAFDMNVAGKMAKDLAKCDAIAGLYLSGDWNVELPTLKAGGKVEGFKHCLNHDVTSAGNNIAPTDPAANYRRVAEFLIGDHEPTFDLSMGAAANLGGGTVSEAARILAHAIDRRETIMPYPPAEFTGTVDEVSDLFGGKSLKDGIVRVFGGSLSTDGYMQDSMDKMPWIFEVYGVVSSADLKDAPTAGDMVDDQVEISVMFAAAEGTKSGVSVVRMTVDAAFGGAAGMAGEDFRATVKGAVSMQYPCAKHSSAIGEATVKMSDFGTDTGGNVIEGNVQVEVYCAPRSSEGEQTEVARLIGPLEGTLKSEMFVLDYITTDIRVFTVQGSKKSFYEGTVKGAVEVGSGVEGLVVDGAISLNSYLSEYKILPEIAYRNYKKGIFLSMQGSRSLGACDAKGYKLTGSVLLGPWVGIHGEGKMNYGVRHCEENTTGTLGFTYEIETTMKRVSIAYKGGTIIADDVVLLLHGMENVGLSAGNLGGITWEGTIGGALTAGFAKQDIAAYQLTQSFKGMVNSGTVAEMTVSSPFKYSLAFGAGNTVIVSTTVRFEYPCEQQATSAGVIKLGVAGKTNIAGTGVVKIECITLFKEFTPPSPSPPPTPLPPPQPAISPPPKAPPPSPPPATTKCDREANGCPVASRCGYPDANNNPVAASGNCCDKTFHMVRAGKQASTGKWCLNAEAPAPDSAAARHLLSVADAHAETETQKSEHTTEMTRLSGETQHFVQHIVDIGELGQSSGSDGWMEACPSGKTCKSMGAVGTITLDIGGDGIEITADGKTFVGFVHLKSTHSSDRSFVGSVRAKDGSYAATVDTAGKHWEVLDKAPAIKFGDIVFDVKGKEEDCSSNAASTYVGSMAVDNGAHDISSGDVTVKKYCSGKYNIKGFSESVKIGTGAHVRSFDWEADNTGDQWTFKMTSGKIKIDESVSDTLTLDLWQPRGKVEGRGQNMLSAIRASKVTVKAALDWKWSVDHLDNSFFLGLKGDIDGPVPCNVGEEYTGQLKMKFTATDLRVPRNYADFVYHCGAKAGQLSWTLELEADEAKMGSKPGDVYAISDFHMHLDSFVGVPAEDAIVGPRGSTTASGVARRQFLDVSSGDYGEYVLAYFTAKMPFTNIHASIVGEYNPQGVSVNEDNTPFSYNENLDVSISIKDWFANTSEGVEMTMAAEGKIAVPNKVRGCDVITTTETGVIADDAAICAQYYYVNMSITDASVVNLFKKDLPGEENAVKASTTETGSINSDGVQAYKIVLFLELEQGLKYGGLSFRPRQITKPNIVHEMNVTTKSYDSYFNWVINTENAESEESGTGAGVLESLMVSPGNAYKLPFSQIVINLDPTDIEGLVNAVMGMFVEGIRNPFLVVKDLGGWVDNLMSRFLSVPVVGVKITIRDQTFYDEIVLQTSTFEVFGMKFELELYTEYSRRSWDQVQGWTKNDDFDDFMVVRIGLPEISNVPDDSFQFPGGAIIRKLLSFPIKWLQPITAMGFRFGDECDGCEIPEIPELTDSVEGFSIDMTFDMTKSSGFIVEAINTAFSALGAGSVPYEEKAPLAKLFYNCSQKPTDKAFVMTMDIEFNGPEEEDEEEEEEGGFASGAPTATDFATGLATDVSAAAATSTTSGVLRNTADLGIPEVFSQMPSTEGAMTVCIARSCPVGAGIPIDDEGFANFTGAEIQFCVKTDLSISVSLEVNMEAILPNHTHPGDKSKYAKRIEMNTEMSFEASVGPPPSLSLSIAAYAKLQGDTQMWVNPFGAMPNAAIVFPLSIGITFTATIMPVAVIPGGVELEFGIAMCRGAPLEPRSKDEQKAITTEAKNKNYAKTKDKSKFGLDEESNLAENADALNAMLLEWKCGDADPYGESPTVIKMALYVDVEENEMGFQLSLREISLGRLILACIPGPINPLVLEAIKSVRAFIDVFYIESLDMSINMADYPLEMTSGTFIPAGILVDVKNMDFFKLIYIERAYVYFSMSPFIIEAQLYIRPFSMKLGSVELFAIRGIEGEDKENADFEAEEAHLARVERANKAKLLATQYGKKDSKRMLSAMHWCDQGPCFHCATVAEAETVTFSCPGTDSLIYNAKHAVWASADSLPAWSPAATAGLCQLNASAPESTPWPDIGEGVTRAPMSLTRDFITEECKGEAACEFTPAREALSTPEGLAEGSALSLMVAVQCLPRTMYEEMAGQSGLDILNALKCVHGCLTCASDSFEEEDEMFDFTMGCFDDGVIVDVVDASYAVAESSPEFFFKPAAAGCTVETIPRAESQCELNEELVMNTLSKYCYGRQMCSFTKLNLQRLFPETILPSCAIDKVMRISAIVKCKRNRMPLEADELPDNNEFNFLHFEERKLASNSTFALSSAYHMRVAFQTSPDILHYEKPDNFTEFIWLGTIPIPIPIPSPLQEFLFEST
jgi:hypothetical protein